MSSTIGKQTKLTIDKQKNLLFVARNGRIEDVKKYLNDDTVDVNGKCPYGMTALHCACLNGYRDIVELLLDHGADVEARTTNNNSTPLMFACSGLGLCSGDQPSTTKPSTTKLLLDRGCTVNAHNIHGRTALHQACARWVVGSTECIKELLANGADTFIKTKGGKTPFDIAKEKEHQTAIDLLMKHEKRLGDHLMDSKQDEKKSILSDVRKDKAGAVMSTIDNKQQDLSDAAYYGRKNQQDLSDAAYFGRISDVKKYLNDATVDVNEKDLGDSTALHQACIRGHDDIVELLLDHGADIDVRSSINSTPLIWACWNNNPSTTKLLLDRGCAVNAASKYGRTALHQAFWVGATECIKELLAHGADTTIKNKFGKTPFDIAKEKEHQTAIDLLMKHEKRPGQYLMDSKQDEKKSILSDVIIPKAYDAECVAYKLDKQLSSKVESIVNHRCKELQEEMNQTVQKLTSDFESKIEALRSEISASNQDKTQTTITNGELAKCVSDLGTIVENLSLKISSSQLHHELNEGTIIEQHESEDDFEMIP